MLKMFKFRFIVLVILCTGLLVVGGFSASSAQWDTNGPDIVYTYDNAGIGTDAPISKLEVEEDLTDTSGYFNLTGGSLRVTPIMGLSVSQPSTCVENAGDGPKNVCIQEGLTIMPTIIAPNDVKNQDLSSGNPQWGAAIGLRSRVVRDQDNDLGIIGDLVGLVVNVGHREDPPNPDNPSETIERISHSAHGIEIQPVFYGGKIDSYYGLYLGAGQAGRNDTDITNRYGVYAEDSEADNYFAGKIGIGTASPDQLVHIRGANNVGIKFERQDNTKTLFFDWVPDGASSSTNVVWGMGLRSNSNDFQYWTWNEETRTTNIPFTITNTGKVGIGTPNPGTKFAVKGLTGTSGYYYVKVNRTNGNFYYASSSERYKEDIQVLEEDFYKILQATPRSFIDKTSGEREIGYIAEEFDEMGLNNLVIYDEDNRPDSLKYEIVSLYLLEIVKDQREQITEQQQKIVALEQRISKIEAKLR